MSAHTCHAEGCNVRVPPRMFGCRPHWFMLPPDMRAALLRVYQPGQESGARPVTMAYLVVQTLCRIAVAGTEQRNEVVFRLAVGDLARFVGALPQEEEALIPKNMLDGARRIVATAQEVHDG